MTAVHAAKDGPSWSRVARDAEDLGYDTLFVIDHVVDTRLAPIAAMAYAAAQTTTLRVGSLVLNADLRHPGLLAKELATVEALSGGRLEIGLGAGWLPGDYEQLGLPMDPPSIRIRGLRESAAIIRSFTSSGEGFITFDGDFHSVRDLLVRPRPVRAGGAPLLLGGGGPKMLRLAGELADIVSVNVPMMGGTPQAPHQGASTDDAVLGRIETVAAAAGERFAQIELQSPIHHVIVSEAPADAAEALDVRLGLPAKTMSMSTTALIGTVTSIVETLIARRERYGFSYVSIPDNAMYEFAPIVEQLRGR
ncbi:MAG: TIGR03621 family F420-dependent LLM class oxidoreductase [Microthrixaceae bacterium]